MRKQRSVKHPVYYRVYSQVYELVRIGRTVWRDQVKQGTMYRIPHIGNLAEGVFWTAIYHSRHA